MKQPESPPPVPGCAVCALNSPDSIVWSDEHWIVSPTRSGEGCFTVHSRRHVEGVWSLSEAEAASYGTLLMRLGRAIAGACSLERLYVVTVGEKFIHFHAAILPRLKGAPVDERIFSVISGHVERMTDAERAGKVAAAVRAGL